ncbi:MAG: alpha/beta hydrolase [Rhizobiales bacterium]|nr:alpha/beta hydrolase [Hyphomicrobiales bacterium]
MIQETLMSFVHHFEPGHDPTATPLLLLHGTGGTEHDLVPLGRELAPGAALLSPRGKVSENGMPRFFRRFAEGRFDEEDVIFRANELADFIAASRATHRVAAPIAIGFSNGANIAAALLLLRPETLSGAILLRAMVPLSNPPKADLTAKPILMLSGRQDPIVPADNAARLAAIFIADGAKVDHRVLPAGHNLSQADLAIAKDWLATHTISLARS